MPKEIDMKSIYTFPSTLLAATLAFAAAPAHAQKPASDPGTSRELVVQSKTEDRGWFDWLPSLTNKADPNVIGVKLASDKRNYRVGEKMRLTVSVDQDAYLYVFSKGSAGKKPTLLYPNKYQANELVKAKSKVSIPGEKDKWEIKVAGPSGTDSVYALASSKPINERDKRKFLAELSDGAPFASLERSDEEVFRELVVQPKSSTKTGTNKIQLKIVDPKS
jgi:hypothetical protein